MCERFTTVDHHRRVAFVVTVGTQIIAVGRYDCLDGAQADVAEVAFLVEDAHQGRGLAQLLLEHLAQAGRERGVRTFVADVLPNNARMIQNFRAAGYQLESGYEEGVMHLVFPIEATDTAVGVMRAREHRAEARSVERIFTASSVAVVGSGEPGDTMSKELVRNLVAGGYTGRVYAVDPAVESVDGRAGVRLGARHSRTRRPGARRGSRAACPGGRSRLRRRQDLGDLGTFYSRFREMPLVSISDDQRKPLPQAKFMTTIHHGIPADLHRPSFETGRYFAFLGRISPEKRPDRAIRIARAAGIPLKIAAKVDKVDEEYFRSEILPLIDGPGVELSGRSTSERKQNS